MTEPQLKAFRELRNEYGDIMFEFYHNENMSVFLGVTLIAMVNPAGYLIYKRGK